MCYRLIVVVTSRGEETLQLRFLDNGEKLHCDNRKDYRLQRAVNICADIEFKTTLREIKLLFCFRLLAKTNCANSTKCINLNGLYWDLEDKSIRP